VCGHLEFFCQQLVAKNICLFCHHATAESSILGWQSHFLGTFCCRISLHKNIQTNLYFVCQSATELPGQTGLTYKTLRRWMNLIDRVVVPSP
jgi:hypothetical protein